MPLADRLSPALTTVRIQQYEVGRAAADVLLDMIETPPERRKPHHIVRPVELIVRGSTSAPGIVRR
jgi:LacI family transcriptional regulator